MSDKSTILIIDDDSFLLDMYSMKLAEAGLKAYTALNAQEALVLLKEKEINPDVILLDLVMPIMDGFELLSKIRDEELAKDAAIVILSNLGEPADVLRAKKLGINDYIVKANATPSEAVEKIKAVLKQRK